MRIKCDDFNQKKQRLIKKPMNDIVNTINLREENNLTTD